MNSPYLCAYASLAESIIYEVHIEDTLIEDTELIFGQCFLFVPS